MAKRKALRYSFRLFDKRGRRIALAKLRYAHAFEVYYGKRRVLARKAFPRLLKRVGERRDLLESLIESIEYKRLRVIEKRKKQREKVKLDAAKKKARTYVKRQLRRPLTKSERASRRRAKTKAPLPRIVQLEAEAKNQILVFPKAYAAPAATAMRARVIDTMIIPVAPDGGNYTKRVVDKEMFRSDVKNYHLAILDFSLNEGHFIPVTQDTIREQYGVTVREFLPHIVDFFNEMKRTSQHFILRLKFLNHFSPDGQLTSHGISYFRSHIIDDVGITNLLRITFQQLQGDPQMGPTSRNKTRRNYLAGETGIYLTGFTLEATTLP